MQYTISSFFITMPIILHAWNCVPTIKVSSWPILTTIHCSCNNIVTNSSSSLVRSDLIVLGMTWSTSPLSQHFSSLVCNSIWLLYGKTSCIMNHHHHHHRHYHQQQQQQPVSIVDDLISSSPESSAAAAAGILLPRRRYRSDDRLKRAVRRVLIALSFKSGKRGGFGGAGGPGAVGPVGCSLGGGESRGRRSTDLPAWQWPTTPQLSGTGGVANSSLSVSAQAINWNPVWLWCLSLLTIIVLHVDS